MYLHLVLALTKGRIPVSVIQDNDGQRVFQSISQLYEIPLSITHIFPESGLEGNWLKSLDPDPGYLYLSGV